MGLKQQTISNVKWSFIESLSLKAIGFILSIILARLLLPEDFGLLAVVNVFYLLVTLFIDGGLKEALIQKNDATEIHYSSVFWMNLMVGVFLYGLLFIAAPYIENFYDYDNLSFYIRLQSLTLIIESFGIIQIAKATKELNLKKVTKSRVPASLLSFGVGIFLALNEYGILSLIIQQLVNTFLFVLFLLVNVRYIPKLIFSNNEIKDLYSFGIKILLSSLLLRVYVQSLNLLFAKFYTPSLLGLNTKARSIQNAPIEIINGSLMKGVYPSMVYLKDDTARLRHIYNFNIRNILYILLLINCIFFFKANQFILIVLGENWEGTTIYLKIIAISSIFYTLTSQSQMLFKVINRMGQFLRLELYNKGILLIIIIFSVKFYSFPTVLIIMMFYIILISLFYQYILSIYLKFNYFKELLFIFRTILILGTGSYLLSELTDFFIPTKLINISVYSIAILLLYICYLWIFDKNLFIQLKKLLLHIKSSFHANIKSS